MAAEHDIDVVVRDDFFPRPARKILGILPQRNRVIIEVGAARPDYLSIGASFGTRMESHCHQAQPKILRCAIEYWDLRFSNMPAAMRIATTWIFMLWTLGMPNIWAARSR